MDNHDEVFESIPWDRLGSIDRQADQRKWVIAALAVALVGVTAFFIRQAPTPAAPIAVTAVSEPLEETIPSTTESPLVTEEDLWAPIPPNPEAHLVAERFVIELLGAGDSKLVGVTTGAQSTGTDGVVTVLAVLETESGSETIAFEVEVDAEGQVSRWGPGAIEPLVVKTPVPGAEPPPEVLAEFTRIAGRWGTTIGVRSSGLSADQWWAEILVRLPSGVELPVMIWEGA